MTAVLMTVFALFAAGCTATASLPEPVDHARYECSADGVTWGGAETIPWDQTTVPVPGGEPNSTTFDLCVSGKSSVKGEIHLGDWSIDRSSAWFRVDVDGAAGEQVTLAGGAAAGSGVLWDANRRGYNA